MVLERNKLLNIHYEKGCMEVEGQHVEVPTPDEIQKFRHHNKKLRRPFVAYADDECLSKELKHQKMTTLRPIIIKSINHAVSC